MKKMAIMNIFLILTILFLTTVNCDLFEMPKDDIVNDDHVNSSSSSSNPDNEPPVLNNITVTPTSLNGPGTIKVMIDAADAGSGISFISIDYYSPLYLADNTGHHYSVSNFTFNSGSGNWEANCEFKNYYETGTWKINYISLHDNAGNYVSYMINTYYSLNNYIYFNGTGYTASEVPINNSSMALTGTSPDIISPVLNSITITPNTINASGGIVTIQLNITEENTGIESILAIYNSPTYLSGNTSGQIISSSNFIYNTGSGQWETSCTFQNTHESGVWKLDNIIINDKAENFSWYDIDTEEDPINYIVLTNNNFSSQSTSITINSSSLTKNE